MAKFYVGQRVRLARPARPENAGWVGQVTRFLMVEEGRLCGDGERTPFECDCIVNWDHERCSRVQHTSQLEPIQPKGAAPSEFTTLADLLTSLSAEAKA